MEQSAGHDGWQTGVRYGVYGKAGDDSMVILSLVRRLWRNKKQRGGISAALLCFVCLFGQVSNNFQGVAGNGHFLVGGDDPNLGLALGDQMVLAGFIFVFRFVQLDAEEFQPFADLGAGFVGVSPMPPVKRTASRPPIAAA